jgi:endonuclease-3
MRIACDVTNPLLGPTGAAAVYGPQKGAGQEAVGSLDGLLTTWADALEDATGRHERLTPGAGAAGGVGFGLLCLTDRFQALALQPGVDLVMDAVGFDAKLADADVVITGEGRIDAQTAYGKTALGVARRAQAAGVRCIAVGGGVEPAGIAALAPLGVEVGPVHERPLPTAEAIALGAAPLVACGERLAARPSERSASGRQPVGQRPAATAIGTKARTKPRRRKPPDPSKAWARSLARRRPGLVAYVLDELAGIYERPAWERRLDPTSELILTVLTQNSADINAERAFEGLRAAFPSGGPVVAHRPGAGWGGEGLADGAAPDWVAVEAAPVAELVEAIRPGGLAQQKAPRIQAALRHIREARGDHSLEFLGDMPALEARDWLTTINGIGPKTASVLLLFCFGTPLMPVDRHVERVSKRIGLIPAKATADEAHDLYLALLEPDQMYEAHVNLIRHGRLVCHARKPECGRCPAAPRCRFVDRRAP